MVPTITCSSYILEAGENENERRLMIYSVITQKGIKMTLLVLGLDPVILDEQFEETYHVMCTLCCEYCPVLFSV